MILSLMLFSVKAIGWFFLLALLLAAVRLFIFGLRKRYAESIVDISVLKKGDIILTGKQSTRYSWYIQLSNVMTRKIKHRFWTHAAIYRGNDLLWEAMPKGIIENKVSNYIKNGFIIRAFRHKYITDETILGNVLKFCEKQEGCSYDFGGLFFYVCSTLTPISFNYLFDNWLVNRFFKLDKAYFCSELVADAFNAAGYPVSPYDGWRVKPSDFISNPLLDPVNNKED